MKRALSIFIFIFLSAASFAQLSTFKKNNKFGFAKDGVELSPPIYDTILPFDSTKKICMACVKTQKPANKFIKTNNMIMVCKYVNDKNESLVLKVKNDTVNYFALHKKAFDYYTQYKDYVVVSARDKKYVVDKQLKQITFAGYDEIIPSSIKHHFIVENKTLGASYFNGVIDKDEKQVVPMEYTHIKSNPFDTLFICCTAQIKLNGSDDVLDITGKKVQTFNRHIDNASKNFVIHRVFEPYEYYIIHDLHTKKEKIINAEDITYLGNDNVNIKIKGKYFKTSLFKLDELKILNE
ncbi:MAG: hypothetical protein IPJ60_11245 [Sphingobacteriaceae bacterium]|nr:hypothetical protein [Sphingobacteriaceae bacterium]